MPLLRLDDVSLAYGHHQLLDQVVFEIQPGERVCLIGRNGEGKSSLLRIASRQIPTDGGHVRMEPGTQVAYLSQEVAPETTGSVFEVVASGLSEVGRLLAEYQSTVAKLAKGATDRDIQHLARLQHEIEAADGWRLQPRIETVLTRLGLEGSADLASLSGGWRRRTMLARALASEPDLLLLDEPTNHLDIEAISWLEEFLASYPGAVLFVSHDRAFLRRLATRIVELDRGRLTSWSGGYTDYLRRKAADLAVEAEHAALFDKRLSQEEAWIRQGIKARRTRNEGRVRALEAMREQRRRRRNRTGHADLKLDEGQQSGKRVFEVEHVDYHYGDLCVVQDFSVSIRRGDRIGLVGPNGAGKSTLIRLLLGELQPEHGSVRPGTGLQIAYFDQQREQLDPSATVMDSVGDGRLSVTIGGKTQHVAGYLQGFLFPPARLRSPVSMLSGGERNRLLLARLFARPANVLVLDEPTNDLDAETLELLEELLMEFQGTLLVVSHDRDFLDHTVTSTLVFEGEGRIAEYAGGYSDWFRYRQEIARQRRSSVAQVPPASAVRAESSTGGRGRSTRKRSYQEEREVETLPEQIELLESEQATLQVKMNEAAFYRQPAEEIAATRARLAQIAAELAACYVRWEILESGSA